MMALRRRLKALGLYGSAATAGKIVTATIALARGMTALGPLQEFRFGRSHLAKVFASLAPSRE